MEEGTVKPRRRVLVPAARMGRSGGARKQGSAPGISGAGLKLHQTSAFLFPYKSGETNRGIASQIHIHTTMLYSVL